MTADEDFVGHASKTPPLPKCSRGHVCTHGTAACT